LLESVRQSSIKMKSWNRLATSGAGPQEWQFRKFANPSPLGLSGFAPDCVYSLTYQHKNSRSPYFQRYDWRRAGLRRIYQVLAGMWEFVHGNMFSSATAFSSYGECWMSFGAIVIPAFGITSAFEASNLQSMPALVENWSPSLISSVIVSFREDIRHI
jgi:succinate-acetate transporter protein